MRTRPSRGRGSPGRLDTGWTLTKDSIGVVRDHPKLLAFPLLAAIASGIFLASLLVPLRVAEVEVFGSEVFYVVAFAVYFLTTFASTFFTVALVYGADEAFHGREPTIGECIRKAGRRIGPILAWSLVAATVSTLLHVLEDSDSPITSTLGFAVSVGWAITTFFVVPVIAFEDVTPGSMLSRSAGVYRETWGETLGTGFGIGIVVFGLVVLPGVAVILGSLATASYLPVPWVHVAAFLLVGVLLVSHLVSHTIWGVAKTALYVYATEETSPGRFDDFDFETLGGRARQSSRERTETPFDD